METKKQQQQPPRMTVKSKGIVISDLKGFLEKKKAERAARVNEVKNNVNNNVDLLVASKLHLNCI